MKSIGPFDVVICGAGIAGSMAATAAARLNASVLVVEEEGYPGGSMTAMGTGPMMTFHAGDKQVIRGLTDELIQRLKEKGLSPGHTVDSTGYTYTVTPFSAEGMKRELEEMMLEAGVTLLYHTVVTAAEVRDGAVRSLTCVSCGEAMRIEAAVYVDATGDGDVLAMAGVPFEKGRPGDHKDQPMTMNFKVNGVDTQTIRRMMNESPERFLYLRSKEGIEKQALRLSFSGFEDLMREGIKSGDISFDRNIVLAFETDAPGEMIVNMTRINGEDPVEPFSLSRAETEGRRQVWELLAFLKAKIPGFSNARLLFSGPRVGIRSSRRLKGLYTLTAEDILHERRFDDGVAAFGYPIDIHSADGAETDSRFLPHGAYYTIPYRCLLNAGVSNLLAAGRNISCTFEAQASTRLSPCCGALGHAAGIAAAMAARGSVLPVRVDAQRLRAALREQGAVVD